MCKCLDVLQQVNKRTHWALNRHIKTDILDKAFKDDSFVESDPSWSDDDMDLERDSQPGSSRTTQDASKIALDPSRLSEFSLLQSQLEDFYANLLLFIRCELASRTFYAFRELSRVNFCSN